MADKNDSQKLLISIFSKFYAQIVNFAILFFLTPFIIKSLGSYLYGIWVLVGIIVNYFSYTEIGLTNALGRNLAVALGDKDDNEFRKLFVNGLFLNFIIFFTILILTFISSGTVYILKINNYEIISPLMLILGTSLATAFPFNSFFTVLGSNLRMEIISNINLLQQVLNAIFSVIVLINGYKLIALGLCILLTTLVINFLSVFYAAKIMNMDRKYFDLKLVNKSTIKQLYSYSIKTFIIDITNLIRFRTDEVVTGSFISLRMVAVYSVANKLIGFAISLCNSFLSALNPFFSKRINTSSDEEKANMFFFFSKFMIFAYTLILMGYVFTGDPFLQLWLGPEFKNTYFPLVLLVLAYYVEYIQVVGVYYMYSSNTHHYFAIISAIEAAANIICSLIFVIYYKMGIIGVALGTLLPMLFSKILIQPPVISHVYKIKVFNYYMFFIKNVFTGIIIYIPVCLYALGSSVTNYYKFIYLVILFIITGAFHLLIMLNKKEKQLLYEKLELASIVNKLLKTNKEAENIS